MRPGRRLPAPRVVGVVMPVHDEEDVLTEALVALEQAIAAVPPGIACHVALVLDDCRDGSASVASAWVSRVGGLVVPRGDRNVGCARRAGCAAVLGLCHELDRRRVWLATTDADSVVPANWLSVQLAARDAGFDLWAGRVRLADDTCTAARWAARYAGEADPVHGASLGFGADLYDELGGFRRLTTGEDRDLHRRAARAGFAIAYDGRACVTTSARRHGRAPDGFAATLTSLEEELGAAG